jgi:putative nucleotidyltransferase with HDIG domain
MLKGDLTRFSPGDLLTFLTHLNQEGVLTVSHELRDSQGLSICFKNGRLTAANSEQADAKVLDSLRAAGLIDTPQYDLLNQARRETGLPLRQILLDSESVDVSAAGPSIELGIREVIFQLFTWETGDFQFTEMSVDPSPAGGSFDCTGLTMDAARQVDEYREFLRNVSSEDLALTLTDAGRQAAAEQPGMRDVLEGAATGLSLRRVIALGSVTSFTAMKAVETALANSWVELRASEDLPSEPAEIVPAASQLFLSYKRSLLKVMQAKEKREEVSELLSYCKDHFEYFLLIAFKKGQVVRCRRFAREEAGRRQGVELPNPAGTLASDSTFGYVVESGSPFFGKAFESPLLSGFGEPAAAGECAIIPLGGKSDESFLLYVRSEQEEAIPGPLHFLELISWQIHPPGQGERTTPDSKTPPPVETAQIEPASAAESKPPLAVDDVVSAVNELPPMPQVVSRVLDLLSDPDSQMSQLVEVLSRDPALVARLIRVSNSALYGRGQETTSLDQAVVRLGGNAVRSLVMAASMRSLFPMDKTNVGIWGQKLWQHSIECGLASRLVAQRVKYPDPEEAFVAGVLHDIGKVVILLRRPEEYREILREQIASRDNFYITERRVLGFDHTDVGELLLEKWQMPRNLQASVKHHHEPSGAGEEARLAYIVGAGDTLSLRHGSQSDPELAQKSNDFEEICRQLQLSPEQVQSLQDEVAAALEHSGLLD